MSVHAQHVHHPDHGAPTLNRLAALATLHCLTGCAIGEVLGLVVGTALGLSNAATIALAVTLAFLFGYSLTMLPLLRAGLAFGVAVPLAFASDSFSIAVMEIVDNAVMLAVPGAMEAPLTNSLFWGALAFALVVAYIVAFPVNRYLIGHGRGHAVVHAYHGDAGEDGTAARTHAAAAHGAHADEPDAAAPPGSPRKLVAVGLAAMAATIAVTTAGAFLLESGGHSDGGPTMTDGGGARHGERPMTTDRRSGESPSPANHHEPADGGTDRRTRGRR